MDQAEHIADLAAEVTAQSGTVEQSTQQRNVYIDSIQREDEMLTGSGKETSELLILTLCECCT